jgi:FAD/FMN-containing dehydrogenase
VRAQAGVLLGELDRETQAFGCAVPAGIVTHTGLAGLTLGGGIGWIMRKHGLTIDQLLSVDVVTADGEFVQASAERNADLFWGVRGGGGNFGIVTDFEFRLHALGPQVMAGPVFWPASDAPSVLRFYRDWIADCPDELMTIVVQRRAPALPVVPPDLVGQLVIAVVACYAGPVDAGERALQPLKSFGSPVLDLCMPKPYLVHQSMFDPSFRHGCWYYVRSCDIAALDDDVIDVMVEYGQRITSPITSVALWQMGGAVSRVAEHETAFNGRHAGFTFNINGNSETGADFDAERDWARRYWSALAPHHSGVYVNFLMEEGEERIRQAYGSEKYDRLKALKRCYDPTNLFRLNQNIPPD